MARFSASRESTLLLMLLAGLCLDARVARAGQPLRFSHNVPGDSKPVILYADQITTWQDGNQRIILLKGTVLVEQGVVRLRMQQGVAWVDQERMQQTGIARVDVYGETDVLLESDEGSHSDTTALIDLHTRGEIRLKSQQSKLNKQPQPYDALYRRASAVRARFAPVTPAPELKRTAFESPAAQNSIVPAQWAAPAPNAVPAPPPPIPPALQPPPTMAPAPSPVVPPSAQAPVAVPAPAAVVPPAMTTVPAPTPRTPPAPPGGAGLLAQGPPRRLNIAPRTSAGFQVDTGHLPNGEQAMFLLGGVILTVRDLGSVNLVDIEADNVVIWTRGNNLQRMFSNLRTPEGDTGRDYEFYLSGNVEIREQAGPESRTLRANEVYYDVNHNVAVARNADLEFKQPRLPDPIHFRADEILQLSLNQFRGYRTEVYASRLPSDPGLKIYTAEANLENKRVPKRNIFGFQVTDRATGQPATEEQRLVRGDNIFFEIENVPFFYLPFLQGDANDPLGPIEQFNFKYDRIFGAQFLTTLNAYDLLGLDPIPGTRWRFDVDYLDRRGPALGTQYDYAGKDLFGLAGSYNGLLKAYGIYDTGTDILGGGRGENEHHPPWRGRFLERHNEDLPEDFTLQFQVSALSDKNFLEQYYKTEFDQDINQETFVYLKQQRENWAYTILAEPRIRNWVTETEWLPRVDAYVIGESFFDRLTYNVHASAAYAKLETPHIPPFPFEVTDQPDNTGRFDVMQELSAPFSLGPVRLVPYGVLDLTYYTQDLTGSDRGRVYAGGGLRASVPFTRLYPDVQSELLNLNGLNHKIVVSSNFYAAHSDTPFTRLPQLDRLNDDATDQALRDIKPLEPALDPVHGPALATSPVYDPQVYAIRRLVDDRIDTLDSIDELEVDIRQRLQTKRGYPGMQHVVDWMTLDLSGSYFPEANRDNFGEHFAFLQYDYVWNVGDRTALVSSGWADPYPEGPKVFTIGAFLNRPDRTNFYLGYREIQPLSSQAVSAAVSYVFSPKYAITASSTYDFGTNQSLANQLAFTRMGSDLQVTFGITYNAILNNFGVTFEILPNLLPENRRIPGMAAFGSSVQGR